MIVRICCTYSYDMDFNDYMFEQRRRSLGDVIFPQRRRGAEFGDVIFPQRRRGAEERTGQHSAPLREIIRRYEKR